MRIDDRKVNAQITIEPGDRVDGLTILIDSEASTATWITGFR